MAATTDRRPAKTATRAKRAATGSGAGPEADRDGLDPGTLAKVLPLLRALRGYTRLKADGLRNVPDGPAILAANHTGWLGLDYALTALVLHDETGRAPRGMVHGAWFSNPVTARFARQVGLSKVSKASMAQQLRRGHLVMVFPEGEKGAFRAASGYEVLEFARGFVRVAVDEGVPIVPVAVLGGEEANPLGAPLKGYEDLLKLQLPLPRNLLPKPVKWRIRFLKPIVPDPAAEVHAAAEEVRARVQAALRRLERERGHPYL